MAKLKDWREIFSEDLTRGMGPLETYLHRRSELTRQERWYSGSLNDFDRKVVAPLFASMKTILDILNQEYYRVYCS